MQACLSVHPRLEASISGLEQGHKLSIEEKARPLDQYLSYAGRYTYNDQVVTHFVEMALNPSIIGTTLKRKYLQKNNDLWLSYTHKVRDTLSIQYHLKWKKQ